MRPICMAILTGEKYEVLNHDGSGVPNFCNFETTQIAAGVKPSHRLDVSSSQVCSPCEVGICKVFGKKKHVKRTQQIKGMWYHGGLQRQTASSRAVLGCKAKSTRLIGNCRQHLALVVLPGCWMQVVLILCMQLGKKDAHELIPSSHPIEEFLNCKG